MLDAQTYDLLFWGLIAFAVTAAVLTVIYPLVMVEDVSQRIQVATTARSKKVAARSAADVTANRKKAVTETLKEIDARKKKQEKASLRTRLQQAGLAVDTQTYWISSMILGVIVAIAVYSSVPASMGEIAIPLACVGGFVGAMGLPGWILSKIIARRQAKFLANLANAIDVIVRGIKTGLPLNECLGIIARESPQPIAGEIKEVVDQQRMGVTLAESLDRLVVRVPLAEVKFLAIVISIQASAGGNLSEALGNLSQVLRDRYSMKLKIKALSAEALASAAVLGSMPPIICTMIYFSAPGYLDPLINTRVGNMFSLLAVGMMGTGIFIMRQMINFKF